MNSTINRIIDRLEGIMEKFGEQVVKNRFEIDKYVGDVPSIRISWEGKDGISRNILVVVENCWLNTEVNAWKDDLGTGKRKWCNWGEAYTVSVKGSSFSDGDIVEIIVMLSRAHEMISGIGEGNLVWTGDLYPHP